MSLIHSKFFTHHFKHLKKGEESTSEIVIVYQTNRTHGELIMDSKYFELNHKKIMKLLDDVIITSMIQRKKGGNQ